jgi:hypothetical protein
MAACVIQQSSPKHIPRIRVPPMEQSPSCESDASPPTFEEVIVVDNIAGRSPTSSKERERHTDHTRPPSGAHRRSEASGRCAISGSAIKVSQQSEIVSAISSRLKRSAELTLTLLRSKRLFESLRDCSTQPLCQYHEAAALAMARLVARYQDSSGALRRAFLALLFDTLQQRTTLIRTSWGRPW